MIIFQVKTPTLFKIINNFRCWQFVDSLSGHKYDIYTSNLKLLMRLVVFDACNDVKLIFFVIC